MSHAAHMLTKDTGTNNLGQEVVPDWPVLALVRYLMIGAEENTSEAHQNYLMIKGHKRKWELLKNGVTHSSLHEAKSSNCCQGEVWDMTKHTPFK